MAGSQGRVVAADATIVHQLDKHILLSLLTSHRTESRLTCLTTFNLFSNRIKSIIHRNLHILPYDAKVEFCTIQWWWMSYRRDRGLSSSTSFKPRIFFQVLRFFYGGSFAQLFFHLLWLHALVLQQNLLRENSVGSGQNMIKILWKAGVRKEYFFSFFFFLSVLKYICFLRVETKKITFHRCFKMCTRLGQSWKRLSAIGAFRYRPTLLPFKIKMLDSSSSGTTMLLNQLASNTHLPLTSTIELHWNGRVNSKKISNHMVKNTEIVVNQDREINQTQPKLTSTVKFIPMKNLLWRNLVVFAFWRWILSWI